MIPGMDDDAPLSPETKALAESLVRRFHAECFWSWRADADISSVGMAREVIRGLRTHGSRSGWRAAAELVKCL